MNSKEAFREGASKGVADHVEMARRVASTARDHGASNSQIVDFVHDNMDRHARGLGRRLAGADKTVQRPSSGLKKTGKGVNRALIAQNCAARDADLHSAYRKAREVVEAVRNRVRGRNKVRSQYLKGQLRLARKLERSGEVREAIRVLKCA